MLVKSSLANLCKRGCPESCSVLRESVCGLWPLQRVICVHEPEALVVYEGIKEPKKETAVGILVSC